MSFGGVGVSKEVSKCRVFVCLKEKSMLFFAFALRNCYKLTLQLKVKTIRNNCERFTRSMRGAWSALTIQRRRHEYPSPLTRNFSSGLTK